jgi:hypothetical protein
MKRKRSRSASTAVAPPKLSTAERRQRLMGVQSDILADALLEFASYNQDVYDFIDRLTLGPTDNISRVKYKIANLRCCEEYIDYKQLSQFSIELQVLLEDIEAVAVDPRIGLELCAAFFTADELVFQNCDDDGLVGDVFFHDATALFAKFAIMCDDKDWVVAMLIELHGKDDYGVRANLFDQIEEFLPEPQVFLFKRHRHAAKKDTALDE